MKKKATKMKKERKQDEQRKVHVDSCGTVSRKDQQTRRKKGKRKNPERRNKTSHRLRD